uniref:Uncharacterized protein n=1 Tax=Aquila chrysaetos chrysaetos TaxID=223781 RepID=A0A663E906_AQUCH
SSECLSHASGNVCLGDVRVRSRAGFETERRGSHPYIDFRIFHCKYLKADK